MNVLPGPIEASDGAHHSASAASFAGPGDPRRGQERCPEDRETDEQGEWPPPRHVFEEQFDSAEAEHRIDEPARLGSAPETPEERGRERGRREGAGSQRREASRIHRPRGRRTRTRIALPPARAIAAARSAGRKSENRNRSAGPRPERRTLQPPIRARRERTPPEGPCFCPDRPRTPGPRLRRIPRRVPRPRQKRRLATEEG